MPDKKETLEERKKRYFLQEDAKTERLKDVKDSTKRFKYLLNLTHLFRHFIDLNASKDKQLMNLIRQIDSQKGSGKPNKKASSGRRRKSEKEEDAELIHDEEYEEETTVLTESPSYIHGKLRDYQIQGLNWLISLYENRLSGILADEMGLGKTLQTISFLGFLRYYKGIDGPFIVVVPKSTLDNWRREFARWTPDVNVLVLQGTKEERAELINDRLMQADFDVCITSFEMVIREKSKLGKLRWEYIVIDEAHRIKNEESALSQIIRVFYSKHRLLITGTPLQNNLHELWALLNFILPDVFGDDEVFNEWFESQGEEDQDQVVQKLHKVLSPFLLRRVKSDVEKSLLPKIETNVYVGMTDMQIKWYRNLLEKDIDAVNGAIGKREGKTRLLNIVMQLRKCCNHPYLFEGAEPGPPYTTDEHLVYNSGKMIVLDKLLKKLQSEGSRVLIFSQMSRLLDILEDYCYLRGYEYCRIDGSTAHEERIQSIDDFNKPNSDKFIFLLTTRAGGLGINLTTADAVVLYDSDWNPQADLQAMDRAHRIGQKKQVKVFRFVTENAIEEKVLERAAQKLRLDQLVIQQGRANNKATSQTIGNTKDDLLGMIQHGAEDVFKNKVNSAGLDTDIEAILNKGKQKTESLNHKYAKLGLDDLQNFTSDSSAYEWNGENFAKKEHSTINLWVNPSRRQRKEHQYSIDNYYKDVLQNGRPSPYKGPKQYNIQDFQFYPPQLKDLLEKEQLAYKKKIGYQAPLLDGLDSEDEFVASDDETKTDQRERVEKGKQRQREEQQKIDTAEELTEEEQKQKEELLTQGFANWNKRDFLSFVHSCARHGSKSYAAIAADLRTKSVDDVKAYSEVFWQRYKEIDGWEKYVNQIEQGEKKIQKVLMQQEILSEKVGQYDAPLQEMNIIYPPNNSKRLYTETEDRFLLMKVNEYGLSRKNLYDLIKADIMRENEFRCAFYFKSRSSIELSRRVATLLLAITREAENPASLKRKPAHKKVASVETDSRQVSIEPADSEERDLKKAKK
ncbi:hypothetical protein KL921_001351 [Ogataea angusta]|uniref:Uncharacterized protein n=1 Tax=Pichia angusta TaxID=870730 RepID=A0AAN6DF93_PICAN|nr:uncharacterized protein KL928_002588 [Ogataea angusta]KAG7812119.1 hypothetical protein KL921_001351 [Ogataea angusta]KAG7818720.1 hypothetical protein KL928_002588 [Ogataea angusta]KAG7824966.1 hypothetical protein KL909_001258 [Ogataea angusta]KAG7830153.1 hypothetical protein KL920_001791 [Ogataea angusta]KAG7834715.1 hypothetical protein KL943_003099 [Ogataea angusta]